MNMKIKLNKKCMLPLLTSILLTQQVNAEVQREAQYNVFSHSLTQSFQAGLSEFELKQIQHRFVGEGSQAQTISSFGFRQNVAGNGLHLNFSHAPAEKSLVLGYSLGRFTFSAMQGESESFVRNAGSLQGVDRFSFHGGIDVGFDYYGFAVDTKINELMHMQLGYAQLDSKLIGLEARGAQYLEFSSNASFSGMSGLYGRLSFYERGNENIGQGLETGFAYKNSQHSFQAMRVDGNKRLVNLSSQFALSQATNLQFSIAQAYDPSHFDATRYTSTLTVQHFIGKKPKLYYAAQEENAGISKQKKSRYNRPLLIGAGVVAGAAIASSGSSSSDSSTRSQAETDAAFAVLNSINPESIRQNREFGGWVYRNQDNTFGTSTPVRGEAASVTLPNPFLVIPSGSALTASYHTHAAFDPRFDNENFSPTDIRSDNSLGIGGYLGTPGGTFQYHFGGNIELLGSLATQ